MNVFLRVQKMSNNHVSFSIFKHTGELFKYQYIEDCNTFKNEYNRYKAIVQLMPNDRKTSWLTDWYEIRNYQENYFVKLAKHLSDSINPYEYFIEEVKNLNSLQWDRMQAISI
jgi:hypothetical protein